VDDDDDGTVGGPGYPAPHRLRLRRRRRTLLLLQPLPLQTRRLSGSTNPRFKV